MLTTALASALALGFLGSLHCTLMCGPVALAGCHLDGRLHARGVIAYFAGRAIAYAFAGALFGSLGAHAQHQLPLADVQSGLLLAVALLALARGVRLLLATRRRAQLVRLRRPSRTARLVAQLLPRRALPLGVATGALPCGLLATAWTLAAASGHALGGALVMIVFSLATLPGLAASLVVAGRFRGRVSPAWAGLAWCALALWIGMRPLLAHAHGGH